VTTLNEYQEEAGTTAVFPRFYTEDQVRSMVEAAFREVSTQGEVDGDMFLISNRWITRDQINNSVERLLDNHETTLSRLVYPILGLVGEAGELANKVKKWGRDNAGKVSEDQTDALADELGDTLWYVAATSTGLQMDLDGIAEANLSKLYSRQQRGTLQGNGDNR